jgi:hypothetical protein
VTKEELVAQIRTAFKGIELEDGIGLWEGQGLDDYAGEKTLRELRTKDERYNWDNIPYKDLSFCYSSLSFFDAKGMRFCLPKFLIFDILANDIPKEKGVEPPDVVFTIDYEPDNEYRQNIFSLLDNQQIQSVISYIEYKLDEITMFHKSNLTINSIDSDWEYISLCRALGTWKQKLN